jgi:integrase
MCVKILRVLSMTSKKINWEKGNFPGIRFYKHENRKHGIKFDRYFSGSYQVRGKRQFIGFGWSSEGWTEQSVWGKINNYKHNSKNGVKPTTLKEEIALKEYEQEEQQKIKDKKEQENIIFSVFFKNVYAPTALKHKKQHTVQNEISFFHNWLDSEIGHLPFNKIKPFNLETIKKNMLDAGRAPRSLQYCFAVFRQVWNHARINDLINEDSPTKKVKLPKVENQRLRFLNHEEATNLLNVLRSKSQQVHDMTLLSLHTGVRAGEIFSLIWGVVDFENSSVLIRDSKGKTRHVYLTSATQTMFEQKYNSQAASDLVFKDSKDKKIIKTSKTFGRAVKELGLNDGVTDRRDKVTFHTCRHTFASWHVQNGTDLYTVKELLGHSTIQLTERYSHLRPDGLKKATQRFDKKVIKSNVDFSENIVDNCF